MFIDYSRSIVSKQENNYIVIPTRSWTAPEMYKGNERRTVVRGLENAAGWNGKMIMLQLHSSAVSPTKLT